MEKKKYICPLSEVIFISEAQHLCEESEWTDEAFGKGVPIAGDDDEEINMETDANEETISLNLW